MTKLKVLDISSTGFKLACLQFKTIINKEVKIYLKI